MIAELELRPYSPDDFERVVELFNAVDMAAYGWSDVTREELQQWFTSSRIDLERDTRLVFDGERLVGYADVDTEDGGETWWNDLHLDPNLDTSTLAAQLVQWTEERCERGIIRTWAPSTLGLYRTTYEANGYRRVRASYRMRIELADAPVERSVVGIDITPMHAGEEHEVYEVHQETFEDSWEHTREPYDEWKHYLTDIPSFDPTLWFVARDGDEIAGVCLGQDRAGTGFVRVLGVRRAWRRRGVGMALLTHAFAEFARRGYSHLDLGVDAESLTGANHLYEAAGMRVARQIDIFEKELT